MWTACILREDLVDCDMDLLHVERSLSMMCSGSHLYSCYRYVPVRISFICYFLLTVALTFSWLLDSSSSMKMASSDIFITVQLSKVHN
jgi:hypothetical protein